ncbi:MAG: nucleoside recognition domain-containing protein [Chloroflexota bacterium]
MSSIPKPESRLLAHTLLFGPWLALIYVALLFALPVYLAYLTALSLEPFVEQQIIGALSNLLAPIYATQPLLFALLLGDYGLLSLGLYSFLWALPVVLYIGISVAITQEMGLQERITAALDPWLRRIGLTGQDLLPVLTGFGCNVVAVFQSRSCGNCTRGACVSMIAFGSACSYQIGASLSIFNAAQMPWLFGPYLCTLFLVAAIHTRLWHGQVMESVQPSLVLTHRLRPPTLGRLGQRVAAVLGQFIQEAMPIFLLFCLIGALLDYSGFLARLADFVAPSLHLFGLPGDAAPGLIFSIVRKDGLLTLNQGQGELIRQMSGSQVFILVYLASTFTACLITLWTVRKELGWREAFKIGGRQMGTSVGTALMLRLILPG